MAIIEFELEGYERLVLKDIKRVHMRPMSKLQMILGTNGSGKTALMSELSLLPSAKADFPNGGFKRIVQGHKGSIYEGLSDFRGAKSHFCLIKDNVVIYEGHSSTAYAAYVKAETGITKDIHAMRIGLKIFTRMKKDERREWFTSLSPEDYSYAIGYYKRLSEATRDITGTINRINTRLVKEKENLISAEEEAGIRKEIEDLKAAKAEMMQYWRPMDITYDAAIGKVEEIDKQLADAVRGFDESIKVFCNVKGYKSQQEIWDDVAGTQGALSVVEQKISDIHESIESNRILLQEAMASAGKDKDALIKELADVSRSILTTKKLLINDDWLANPSEALVQYDQVMPGLIPLMSELIPDPELLYTQSQHKINTEKLVDTQKLIEGWTRELNKHNSIVEAYEHRSKEDHTTCPKCEHTWINGYSVEGHEKVIAKRDEVIEVIAGFQKQYEALHAVLEKSSYQLQLFNQIGLLARSNALLDALWKGLTETNLIRISPQSAIEHVRSVRMQIELSIELKDQTAHKEELEKSLEALNHTSGLNYKELQDKNDAMERSLIDLQNEQFYLNASVSALRKAQKAMEYQEGFVLKTDDLLAKRNDWISKAEIANKHTAINSAMIHLETEISERERRLSLIDTQHSLIRALEEEVQQSQSKAKLMKKAMKALSPSEGLIARGLTGFINHFIAQMNAVIEKVWQYPLVIQPIKLTDDTAVDLDYNFSFLLDGKTLVPDVADGSGAQKEIFDIAFMLVSMMHLNLDESEIFLDEFSIKMDYAHRREATKMVMDLISTSNFSQIYMISHYENSYGTMGDVDITVLCAENIQLPASLKYNVNSTVER